MGKTELIDKLAERQRERDRQIDRSWKDKSKTDSRERQIDRSWKDKIKTEPRAYFLVGYFRKKNILRKESKKAKQTFQKRKKKEQKINLFRLLVH